MSSNTVYILSASYHGDRLMYIGTDNEATLRLGDAKIFPSDRHADEWKFRKQSTYWQVQPISAKKLFAEKLKGT